jgi:protein SCO1/2
VVTAAWWALALWPVAAAPPWFLRTRDVCFGSSASGLPNAGGWVLLVGQPIGMLAVLAAVWPAELRTSLGRLRSNAIGQLTIGLVVGGLTVGVAGVVVRIAHAGGEEFSAVPDRAVDAPLVRLSDSAPAMALVNQHGRTTTLEAFHGRPVIVTFAYAHCDTVCPFIVEAVLAAQARVAERSPVVLVVTLDPWRDTPGRLASIADAWRIGADAHVLSGPPDEVERVLSAWRVPRARNERTGDLSHPSLVYVIGPDGRIAYAVGPHADAVAAAVRAL